MKKIILLTLICFSTTAFSQTHIDQVLVGDKMPAKINLGGFQEVEAENCNCRMFEIYYENDLNDPWTNQSIQSQQGASVATNYSIHYDNQNTVTGIIKINIRSNENTTQKTYYDNLDYDLKLIRNLDDFDLIENEDNYKNDYSIKYYSYLIDDYNNNISVIKTTSILEHVLIEETYNPNSSYKPRIELKNSKYLQDKTPNHDQTFNEKIFIDITKKTPLFIKEFNQMNERYIVGIIDNSGYLYTKYEFITLSLFANKWHLNKSIPYGDDYSKFELIDKFETIELNQEQYIYFSIYEIYAGSAMAGFATIKFMLYNPYKNFIISLDYAGTDKHEYIDGSFTNIDEFKNEPELLKFLETKVKECDYIYRPTEEDLDINNPKNFEKRWNVDNPNIDNIFKDNGLQQGTLHIVYYDEELMSFNSANYIIENKDYIIAAFWRNNIVGYDKARRKYFPIWIEWCNNGCDKKIFFEENGLLNINWHEFGYPFSIKIDLSNNNFIVLN